MHYEDWDHHFACSPAFTLSCAVDRSGRTPMYLLLSSQPQKRSTTNRKRAINNVVVSTTTVSWNRRFLLVQETLFISASVAIRNSAKVGTLTARYAIQRTKAASINGIVTRASGNSRILSISNGMLMVQL